MNIFLTPGTVPAGSSLPGNLQTLINLVCQYALVGGAETIGGINYGSDTPSPENRSFPWWRTDVDGNPLGMYNWDGSAWVTVASVITAGPTSTRPITAATGTAYFDTTIARLLIWERGQWRTADGGVGEIRYYEGTSIDQVLTLNPGWINYSNGSNKVLAGQSTDHPYGSSIGAESQTLTIAQLPSHSHSASAPTCSNADNGDVGVYVISSNTEPNASNLFSATTGLAGSGDSVSILQPTLYVYMIQKT